MTPARDPLPSGSCALENARRHPALAHLARALDALRATGDAHPDPATLARVLAPFVPVRFVEEGPRPRGARRRARVVRSYDAWIVEEGVVPTRRDSLHDLANALVWACFPLTKRALHARQYAARHARTAGPRTREGDALAMLDEGGVVLMTRPEHAAQASALLASGAWLALTERIAARELCAFVLGHGIIEHVMRGGSAVPHAYPCLVTSDAWSDDLEGALALADARVAAFLTEPSSAREPVGWPGVPLDALHPELR